MSSCVDFLIAGQDTTSTTLRWAMLIMAKHVYVQENMRQEILEVVGTERLPTVADQVKRVTLNDVQIRGHKIPAGTWVNGDVRYIMSNDPVFVKPKEFKPERYLHEDGVTLKRDLVERTLPFSLGKRACAGEGLARVEIFLGPTSTIQHYRILPPEGMEIDLEPNVAATFRNPKPQNLRLEK
ncbi:hypothetical protein PRIPAC_79690, partial [Pristionchus pacificus]|uniref:Cytochrome P450 n=1 Tax=Pristionchus pacificus TaxID=54126 RepID=A0A2A6C3D5_PRIPA